MTIFGFETFSKDYLIVFGCLAALTVCAGLAKNHFQKKRVAHPKFINPLWTVHSRGRSPTRKRRADHSTAQESSHQARRFMKSKGKLLDNNVSFFGIRALEAGFHADVVQAYEIPRQSSLMRRRRLNMTNNAPAILFDIHRSTANRKGIVPQRSSQRNIETHATNKARRSDRMGDEVFSPARLKHSAGSQNLDQEHFHQNPPKIARDPSVVDIDETQREARVVNELDGSRLASSRYRRSMRRQRDWRVPKPKRTYFSPARVRKKIETQGIRLTSLQIAKSPLSGFEHTMGVKFPDDILVKSPYSHDSKENALHRNVA